MSSIAFPKKSYLCVVNQLNFSFMSHKSSGASLGDKKPSGVSPMSLLLTHLKLMRDEKSCVIPLSGIEFEFIIVALDEYKLIHTSGRVEDTLSEKGVSIVDSLLYHLRDYYASILG